MVKVPPDTVGLAQQLSPLPQLAATPWQLGNALHTRLTVAVQAVAS